VTVHELLAGIEPPVKVTLEALAVAVPPQVVLALPDTNMPLGKVSVSDAVRTAAVSLVLFNVIVRVEMPPELIVAGLKALPTVGLTLIGGMTVSVAMAGAALLPLTVCNAPTRNELM